MHGSRKSRALSREQFEFILDEFKDQGDHRMELVCLLLGRCIRVRDVLVTLTLDHLYGPDWMPRDMVGFDESKTGKRRNIQVGSGTRLRDCLERYSLQVRDLPRDSRTFYGKKTGLPLEDKGVKKLLMQFVGKRGIEQCSPHSFRKYGARYLYFQCSIDIETISQLLNHASVRETRTYMDIKPAEIARADEKLMV